MTATRRGKPRGGTPEPVSAAVRALLDALGSSEVPSRTVETLAVRAAADVVGARAAWLFPATGSAAPLPSVRLNESLDGVPAISSVSSQVRAFEGDATLEVALGLGRLVLARADGDVLALWLPGGQALTVDAVQGLRVVQACLEAFRVSARGRALVTRSRQLAAFVEACLDAQPQPPGRAALQRLCEFASLDSAALLGFDVRHRQLVLLATTDGGAWAGQPGPTRLPVAEGTGLAVALGGDAWLGRPEALGLGSPALRTRDGSDALAHAVPVRAEIGLVGVLVFLRRSTETPWVAAELVEVEQALGAALRASASVARLAVRGEDQAARVAIGRALQGDEGRPDSLGEALQHLVSALGADWGRILVVEGELLRAVATRGIVEGRPAIPLSGPLGDPLWLAMQQGPEAFELDPLAPGPVGRSAFMPPGPGRVLVGAIPAAAGSGATPLGLVVLGRREVVAFDRSAVALFDDARALVGQALQRAAFVGGLLRRLEALELVDSAVELGPGGAGRQEAVDGLLGRVAEWAGTRGAALLRVEGDRLVLEGRAGAGAAELRSIALTEGGIASEALHTGVPVERREAEASAPPWVLPLFGWCPSRLLALPLARADGGAAVLLLAGDEPGGVGRALDARPLQDAMGSVATVLARSRQAEAQVAENARLREEQAGRLRRERIRALGEAAAAVAHEVRTPLGTIYNSLGQLVKGLALQPDERRHSEIVRQEVQLLGRIVNDLLDLARPMQLAVRRQPLRKCVDEAVATAEAIEATRRAGRFFVVTVVEVDPMLPDLPHDERLLRQALVHLLENAFQATRHEGRVLVRAGAAQRAGVPVVRLEVVDDGPGVPPELRKQLFEPFRTSKAAGSGLGLAMVRRIVERHGGSVWCEEATPVGARFVLELPMAGPPEQDDGLPWPQADAGAGS